MPLVTNRKVGQRVLVRCQCGCGHTMWIQVVDIGASRVRLAFDSSDPQMVVEREEADPATRR